MNKESFNYEALLLSELEEATWMADISGDSYLVLCENVANVYGYPAKKFQTDPELFNKMIHPEDRKQVKSYFAQLYKEAGQRNMEYRLIDANGDIKNVVEHRKSFMREGKMLLLSIVRDVTEEREARKKLEESEASLKAIFDNSLQSFLLLDLNYRIKAFNDIARQRTKDFLGIDLEVGKSMLEIVREEHKPTFLKGCEEAMHGRYLRTERKVEEPGKEYWFEFYYAPTKNEHGKVTGVFHASMDITEKKMREKELRDSEEKYRQLVERARDGICIIKDGKVEYANPKLLEMWGGKLEDVIGKPLEEFVHDDYVPLVQEYYDQRIKKGISPELYEVLLLNRQGKPIPAEISAGLINYGGGVASLVIIRDMTERNEAERAIREAESKFRSLVEQSLTGIYIIVNGEIKYVNPRLAEIFGFDNREELENNYSVIDLVHPDDRDQVVENIRKRMEGEEDEVRYEFRAMRKDGSMVHVEVHGIRSEYEGKRAIIGTMVDITERHKVEQRLRESEEKYRQFFDEDITGDFLSTPEGKLLDCNKRYVEIFGYDSKEELMKVDTHELYPSPEIRQQFLKDLKSEGQLNHYVLHMKKKSGETVIIEENVLTDRDDEGNIVTIRGYLLDITDRVKAQSRLKESEQRLKLAINASNIGLYDTDLIKGSVVANDKYSSIYDDPSGNIKSVEKWMSRIYEQDKSVVQETIQNLSAGNPEYTLEYRIISGTDNLKWLHDSGRVVSYTKDGSPKRVLGTILDITEQKTAEVERLKLIDELTQQNTNLKQFSYIVSHNLRKPVANLSGLMEIISKETQQESGKIENKRVMDMINRSVKELEDVIMDLDQILLVRHGTGKQYEKLSILEVVNRTKKLLAQDILQTKAKITTNLKVRKIWSVKSYLHSIIYNLVSNALKYSRKANQPLINISTHREKEEIVLKISDNGVGMDLEKDRSKLFNLYSRLNVQKEGRGVGLFLVKTQVEFMNGRIEVDSKLNEGTTFTIFLPEYQEEDSKK